MSDSSEQPPGEKKFDYIYHLKLEQLLSTMRQVTSHPEEHLFVTVHHVLELWFKHIIFDLHRIIEMIDADNLKHANWLLRRIGEILKLAESHWTVLETMSAADFAEFRGELLGASGMQSRQFREVEVMIGLCETASDDYSARVEQMWPGLIDEHPRTLRKAFFGAFDRHDTTLLAVYQDRWRQHDLFQLAENAFEIDRRQVSAVLGA